MGDLPEPKQERVSAIADPIQMNLGQRQARRLSSLVGLDQVNSQDTIKHCLFYTYQLFSFHSTFSAYAAVKTSLEQHAFSCCLILVYIILL